MLTVFDYENLLVIGVLFDLNFGFEWFERDLRILDWKLRNEVMPGVKIAVAWVNPHKFYTNVN